jgi:hypothetical protein
MRVIRLNKENPKTDALLQALKILELSNLRRINALCSTCHFYFLRKTVTAFSTNSSRVEQSFPLLFSGLQNHWIRRKGLRGLWVERVT